jgi:TP901 family phage tail tape measure protein
MAKSIYQILIELEGDQRVTQSINELGRQIGLSGAALTAFSGASAKMAADYETALANVATVSGEATGTTDEFSQALYGLQADMNGAINVQSAAVASYDILSAGIKDQTAVMQALESSQKAAIAGQSDINAVSKAAVSVVNSYGDALGEGLTEAEKFDKVINLMLQTQLDGVITADEYASSVGAIAAGMKTAGLSIEEFNAIIAVTTAKGIPAASSFTNLNQAISNIQKPSKAATDEAERMGIEFGAARLQAVGLNGILRDMVESGEMQADTLSKMFESSEARNSIAVLVDNLDGLDTAIQSQVDGLGALDKAYGMTSETLNQRVTNSLNLAQGALIQFGQGVIIAAEPFIELLAKLAQQLAEVDPKILQLAGSAAIIGGGILTAAGAFALLVTGIAGTIKAVATIKTAMGGLKLLGMVKDLGAMTAGLKNVRLATLAANMSMKSLATGMKGVLLSGGPLLIMLASIPWLLDKLGENNANRELEELNNQLRLAQIGTQGLADKASQLGMRIQETGKAIPEKEFDQWIKLLEEANEGNDQLTGIIEALKRTQAAAVEANKEQTGSNKDNAQSAEDAAAAYEDYAKKVASSVQLIDQQKANAMASVSGSESEQIKERIRINEEATHKQIRLLQDLARQSGTTAEERLRIETEIQTKSVALNQDRVDANRQLEELHTQYLRDAYNQRRAELEAYKLAAGATSEQVHAAEKQLLQDIFNTEKSMLQAKIEASKVGSAERQGYITQLAELELQYLQDSKALLEAKLQVELDGIQQLISNQTAYMGLLVEAQNIQQQYVTNANANLSSQQSMLETISSSLSDQNMSLSARSELLGFLSELTGESVDIDSAQRVIQQEIEQIEQRKLELKIRQLEIERQQLQTQSQIKQLELQGERQSIQAEINSGTKSKQEVDQLRQRDSNLASRQELERQMTELLDQSLADSISNTQLEARLDEILRTAEGDRRGRGGPISASYLGQRTVEHAKETGRVDKSALDSWRESGQISKDEYNQIMREATEAANQTQEKLAQERKKAEEKAEKQREQTKEKAEKTSAGIDQLNNGQGSQLESLGQLNATGQSGLESSKNLLGAVNKVSNSMPVVIDRLTAVSQTATVISRQVDFIQKQLNQLPGQIAKLMPRPAPPSKK